MTKEKKILFSTIQVTALTLFVKFLGLIKQSVLAACCGATMETDAFFLATGTMVNLSTIIFSAISISLLTIHTNVLFHQSICDYSATGSCSVISTPIKNSTNIKNLVLKADNVRSKTDIPTKAITVKGNFSLFFLIDLTI